MFNISEKAKETAESMGMIIQVQESDKTAFINIRRKDNNLIICSFVDDGEILKRMDLTTMNAEDFNNVPESVSYDDDFTAAVKSAGVNAV